MQIVCPNCTTAYDIAPGKLGGNGRSVRCVRCRTVWVAMPAPEPVAAIMAPIKPAAAPRPAVVHAQSGPDEPLAKSPAAEDALTGEFEWSLKADRAEQPDPVGSQASPDDAAQADAAAAWSGTGVDMVDQAPSLVPTIDPEMRLEPQPVPEPDNIETVAARRAPKAKKSPMWKLKLPRPGMSLVAVALAAILVSLVLARSKVVAIAPQTATFFSAIGLPVNLRGLAFENVRTTGEVNEGVPVLIVEGTIANVTNKGVDVPRLRFALRNRAGQEIYAWTSVTGRNSLAPGETAPFRTRLASPPAEGRDVVVRFFNRRDLMNGMR